MYDPSRALLAAVNLHAGAVAIDNAQNQKFYDVTDPWETTVGPMPRLFTIAYRDGQTPAVIAYKLADTIVFAIAGIQGANDAQLVYRGYLDMISLPGYAGKVNAYAALWFNQVLPAFQSAAGQTIRHVVLFGHSWGSTTAIMLANWATRFRTNWTVRVATYGSPRFCTQPFLDEMRPNEFARVHHHGDLVPYIMPFFTEAPAFHALHTAPTIIGFNSLRHMGNGVRIKRGDPMTMTETPSGFTYPLDINPTAVRQILATNVLPHLTSEYVDVLAISANAAIIDQRMPTGLVRMRLSEEGPSITPQDAIDIQDWPETEWPDDPQPGNVAGIPVPPPEQPEGQGNSTASSGRIRIGRDGNRWFVYLDDEVIYKADSRKDARAVARGLRHFGDQFIQNIEGFIDPGELLDQLAEEE